MVLPSGPFFTLICCWNNFLVNNAAATKNWFTASAIWLIADPSFLSNFIPMDFFLFPKANGQLTGLPFAQEILKKTWGGVSKNVTTETFTATFHRWFERRKKCVRIGGGHAKKN